MSNTSKKKSDKKSLLLNIYNFIFSSRFIFTLLIILLLFSLMLVIYLAEKKTNPNMKSIFDAFWYTLVTITTVGYGDISPASKIGRIAAMILVLLGVAIFGALSGKFASSLFDRQQKKDRGLLKMQNMKNHFLILGWKPDFERILEGIHYANPEIPVEKLVLLNNANIEEMEKLKNNDLFKNINWVNGDFTDEATLFKAQIKSAQKVLILADKAQNYSTLETDSRTVLAVITIKNLNPRIYCVAEIYNSKFEKHLSLVHCDEIIISTNYEQNILFQASAGKGMSHILSELISEDTKSGIGIEDIPENFIGKKYIDFKQTVSSNSILIGLLENTGNFYHRRNEALAEAQKNPDMQQIVSNLKRIKTLKSNLPRFIPDDDYIIPNNSKAIFIYKTEENLS